MRREGRMHGWVYAYERSTDPLDPSGGKRRAVNPATEQTANGGFVRVSSKPTNHSKFTGGGPYKDYSKRRTCKGSNKFKYDEVKMYYLDALDLEGGGDGDCGIDM